MLILPRSIEFRLNLLFQLKVRASKNYFNRVADFVRRAVRTVGNFGLIPKDCPAVVTFSSALDLSSMLGAENTTANEQTAKAEIFAAKMKNNRKHY